jgi:patatin-like phospholipase/acyl hydrolase
MNVFKVLSIDGGGIRGVGPAMVLAEIEERTGRPAAERFDLIVGTSTGGILALGLTRPGDDGKPRYAAEKLIGLY